MPKYSFRFSRRFNLVERSDIVSKSQECLWTNEAKIAREYLLDERKLSEETVRKFHLGYMPESVDHQLHGRIIMPLYDPSDNLIAITSRLPRAANEYDALPVYWHEGYEKSFYLYGLNVAKQDIIEYGFVILVEGQVDVMQMHSSGATNTVGLCSTNLSDIQLAAIYRYCQDIILLLDNDENQSGQKGVSKILKQHAKVLVPVTKEASSYLPQTRIAAVRLQNAKDPDEYIKRFGFAPLKDEISKELEKLRTTHVYS